MNIETLRDYCLAKPHVTEECPFGPDTLVFKVVGKIFLLTSFDRQPLSFNVKCDPDRAINLREEYPNSIYPGYHMNKKHWNTVVLEEALPVHLVGELIDHSYDLVVSSLPIKVRHSLSL